ncbi:MAG: TRAM domain-containing protein [Thermoplasmata archaeon]|nr:TRAM domain-containing protein [Thermoplasmata archaeon]
MTEPESGKPIPLEVGKVYLANIEDSGGSVEGLANLNGHLVFVPGVRPGQDVRIRITKILGRVAFGEIER